MLYHLSFYLKQSFSFFNVIHYVSFRAMAALLSSLLSSFVIGSWFIKKFHQFLRSKSREWTPASHRSKDNMPTMGGIFILMVVILNCLLWLNLSQPIIWIFLFCLGGFGAIGCMDDWYKIKYKKGMYARTKFLLQLLVATITAFLLWLNGISTIISFPFFKNLHPDIGYFFIVWMIFIIIGTSNAVNLTDGLDGLAIGSLIWNFSTFSLICYLAGNWVVAQYLHIPFADSAEVTIIGTILVGASIGFLWYNSYPAQIFMGDVGSLALGAALAFMAIVSKQELLLPLSGGLFVIEALSVIIQIFSYKYLGKRVFKMAPIHHHFELLGWPEAKITTRFGIISLILCLLALMTLKIR